jgi:hypothetical protein
MMQSKAKANQKERGQAVVEFALLLPLFLIVLFIIIDFGVGISRWTVVTSATREGARIGAVGVSPNEIKSKVAVTSNDLLDPLDVHVNYVDNNTNNPLGDHGDSVVVESDYDYQLITPLRVFLGIAFDSLNFHSCTDMRVEVQVSGASNDDTGVVGC